MRDMLRFLTGPTREGLGVHPVHEPEEGERSLQGGGSWENCMRTTIAPGFVHVGELR